MVESLESSGTETPLLAANDDARSVVRNATASIAGQLANLLAGLFSGIYVARILSKEQFGMYTWAFGVCAIGMAIANAGLDNVLVREVARRKDKASQYLMSALIVKVVASAFCYSCIILYLYLRGYTGLQLAVGYVLCSTVISESFGYSCRAVLAGLERQDLSAAVSVGTNVVRVVTIIILVYSGMDILAVVWVTTGASVLAVGVQLVLLRKLNPIGWRPNLAVTKYIVVIGSSFLASDIFLKVFDRADYIILDIKKGVASVAVYGVAYKIIEIVSMIGYSASLALFPIVSRRAQGAADQYARAVSRSTKYLTVFGVPLCTGIVLLSSPLIVGLYGHKYAASGPCLSLLTWSTVASFAFLPGMQSVAARNAQLRLVPPVIVRTILNLGLNLYLIPRYGYIGASIAMIVSNNVYLVAVYFYAFGEPERFSPLGLLGRPILATGVMAAGIFAMRPLAAAHPILLIPISALAAAIYLAASLALRVFDDEDKRIIGGLASGFRKKRAV